MRVRRTPAIVAGAFLGFFLFLFFVYAAYLPSPNAAPSPLDARRFVVEQQESVRKMLSDPESARFRDEFVSIAGSSPIVCGWVNFKNPLGGYDGYRRFVAGARGVEIEGMPGGDDVVGSWPRRCVSARPGAAKAP
jgi:hypothetical protein